MSDTQEQWNTKLDVVAKLTRIILENDLVEVNVETPVEEGYSEHHVREFRHTGDILIKLQLRARPPQSDEWLIG